MTKGRMEAFTDGVIAILITIMVLDLKTPVGGRLQDLRPLLPVFASYSVSFLFLGIYWNNHHHMMHAVKRINGSVLWANHYLLFCLSFVPFATSWMGNARFSSASLGLYGVILFMSGMGYFVLARVLIRANGRDSKFAQQLGSDFKGKVSVIIYALGIACSFFSQVLPIVLYLSVSLIWLIPDKRFERGLGLEDHRNDST